MFSHATLSLVPSLFALSVSAATSLPFVTHLSYSSISPSSSSHHLATIAYDPSKYASDIQSWTPPDAPLAASGDETNLPLIKVLTETGGSTLTSIGVFNETVLAEDGPGVIIKLALDPEGHVFNAFVTAGAVAVPSTKKISKSTKSDKPKSKARLEREAREAAREAKLAEKSRLRSAKKAVSTAAALPSTSASAATSSSSVYPKVQVQLIPSIPGPAPKLSPARAPRVTADGSQLPTGAQVDDDEQAPEKSFLQKYWWILLILAVLAMTGGGEK